MDARARGLPFYPYKNKEFYEFYGIMIGDGSLYHSRNCKYFFTISEGEYEYALYIAGLAKLLTGKEIRIKYRAKAYRIEFKSKTVIQYSLNSGFP